VTSLPDRPNTALLVIDMQRGVVADAHEADRVISTIASLVERARSTSTPVIWIQHRSDELPEGSDAWQFVDGLGYDPPEPVVHKSFGDSFEETDLEAVLADQAVGHLVVTGAQTDACVRSTLHGGLVRGYDVTLVEDAHTTEDLRKWGAPLSPQDAIAYTNMYWAWSSAPARRTAVVPADDVDFDAA
jgi:nicotinamidase-related amidase